MGLQIEGKGNLELVKHIILTWRLKKMVSISAVSLLNSSWQGEELTKYLTVFCTGREKTTVILFQHSFLKTSMPHLRAIVQTC